jgi:site-specific DNA-methyltransferase (adenine-specific)
MNLVLHGDCIDAMEGLDPASVDLVCADVPYGQTRNAWDKPIPFEPMWQQLHRVTKPDAAIVLMAAQPFASKLICSNLQDFRYDLIWRKNKPTGFLNAKKQPLRNHEHILVFYRKPPFYCAQKTTGHKPGNYAKRIKGSSNYGAQTSTEYGGSTERYPTSVIDMPIINNDDPDKAHPTQKPVGLMGWIIRSYSKPGDVVLDIAAGSGTTAIAALRDGRKYVCIEQETEYINVIHSRLSAERNAMPLLAAE